MMKNLGFAMLDVFWMMKRLQVLEEMYLVRLKLELLSQ